MILIIFFVILSLLCYRCIIVYIRIGIHIWCNLYGIIFIAILANGIRLCERIFKLLGRLLGNQKLGCKCIAVRSNCRTWIYLQATRADHAWKFEQGLRCIYSGPSYQVWYLYYYCYKIKWSAWYSFICYLFTRNKFSFVLRYPNLNVSSVTPIQVRGLVDTDDPDSIKQPPVQSDIDIPKKRRRRGRIANILWL